LRLLTIDSSVFVSAARPGEVGHRESTAFLSWVRRMRPRLFLPTLVMVEVAAALSRTGSAFDLARKYALSIGQLPNAALIALDEGLAVQGAGFGARHKLRGADAVYVATAALFSAELVTLDREQLERGSAIVRTLTPAGFLSLEPGQKD
jgi:predicted nucleic acid-binding protein